MARWRVDIIAKEPITSDRSKLTNGAPARPLRPRLCGPVVGRSGRTPHAQRPFKTLASRLARVLASNACLILSAIFAPIQDSGLVRSIAAANSGRHELTLLARYCTISQPSAGSRNPCSRIQRRRARATSARCCSAARKLFFNSDVMACEEAPKCGAAAVDSVLAHRRNDLIQRQIRLLSDESEYPLRMPFQRRNASSAWFWPRNALCLPVLQPSNCGTCADLQLLGGFPPRCSRFNKSNNSYSHFTGIRAAHGSPPKGESMRINSLPTRPLGIPQFTSAGKRFRSAFPWFKSYHATSASL